MIMLLGSAWLLALALVLVAGTAAVIRYLWAFQPAWTPAVRLQKGVATVYWLALSGVCLLLPLGLVAPNVGILFGGMLLALVLHVGIARRSEFARTLNEAIPIVATRGGSLPEVLRAIAWGQPFLAAGRVRRFCIALERGIAPLAAARQCGLPLEIDALLALQGPSPGAAEPAPATPAAAMSGAAMSGAAMSGAAMSEATMSGAAPEPEELWDRADGGRLSPDQWPAEMQFAYLLTLWISALAIGFFLLQFILPVFRQIFEEFDFEVSRSSPAGAAGSRWLLQAVLGSGLLLSGMAIGFVVFWRTDWRAASRAAPLIGPLVRARRRARCLQALATAMSARREPAAVLREAAQVERRRGQRRRWAKAAGLLEAGGALGPSLGTAGLIDRKAEPWIASAAATGRLPCALRALAAETLRRGQLRFELSMAILFPLGVIAIGAFVLWMASWVIGSLAEMIHELA